MITICGLLGMASLALSPDVPPEEKNALPAMRVKVFPHDYDYAPHHKERQTGQVILAAESSCRMHHARDDRAQKYGAALREAKEFSFEVKQLNGAYWLACQGPVTLTRPGMREHFTYNGDFYLRRRDARTLEVVNIVPLQQYLEGVLPSEAYGSWPLSTLKAQTIAARTYAIFHAEKARRGSDHPYFDVDDSIRYQVYTGITPLPPAMAQAIGETRGEILTHNGMVISAYYHADSGGHTASCHEVWGIKVPYCQGRPDPFPVSWSRPDWAKSLQLDKVQRQLERQGFWPRGTGISTVSVPATGRTASGRVRFISLSNQAGISKKIPLSAWRKVVGSLPSDLFRIELKPANQELFLTGLGFGHGAGMSQKGAAWFAEQRQWSYNKILSYYYPKSHLCNIEPRAKSKRPLCQGQSFAQK